MNVSAIPLPVLLRRSVATGLAVVVLAGCVGAAGQGAGRAPTPSIEASTPASPGAQPASLANGSPSLSTSSTPLPDGGPSPSPSPSPVQTQAPSTTPAPASLLDPPARPGPFAIDLYRRGDFASQARTDWCVPAAILTMARIIDGPATGGLPSQRALDRRARALSSARLVGRGSEPQGWAAVLDRLGYGPYVVVARATRRDAIATAARAIRLTGRPVGLLVWRGAHAWVMSGFEATADPAWTDAFTVTRIRVSDPWYPRASAGHGRTRPPDSRIGMAALARDYLSWRRPFARYAELDGRYVLVLPVS